MSVLGFFDTPLPLNAPTVWCKNCVFCNLRDRWYAGLGQTFRM